VSTLDKKIYRLAILIGLLLWCDAAVHAAQRELRRLPWMRGGGSVCREVRKGSNHKKRIRHKAALIVVPFAPLVVSSHVGTRQILVT
jgi:hypothetical protein